MIRGATVLILFLVVSWTKVMSQELSHSVMVPAAGIVSTGGLSYTQTVGETAIEIISGSGFVFTQGFQQPGIKIEPDINNNGNGVNVYPNPVTDFVYVKLFGNTPRKFKIEVISMVGTVVTSGTLSFITTFSYEQQIDMGNLKSGFYLVRVYSEDGVINRTFKIEKM
jgi:hypothetical protein